MTRWGVCVALVSIITAQAPSLPPAPVHAAQAAPSLRPQPVHRSSPRAGTTAFQAPETFQKYCFECHGGEKHKGDVSIERLIQQSSASSVGDYWDLWDKIAEKIETKEMPPEDKAERFPTDGERLATVTWIRTALNAYEAKHGGEPGHVTVRRLTSAEYAYAIRDLTGIDVKVGVDASSDSVGGEGFTNFGDVQFVEDTRIERYLEAAKEVADHATLGAGALDFFADPGKTGLELSALSRIDDIYASKGFRVVSGEGGRPFGLERYGKAFFVAWYYKHRAALGNPSAPLRALAARENIPGRFAEHIWGVVNKPNTGYPTRVTVDAWLKLPAPTPDSQASVAAARAGCDAIYKALTTWPSWFFARGDLAAGGAGDESPLMFDDISLKAEPTHHYTYPLALRGARGRGAPAPPTSGPVPVHLTFASLNPAPGVAPVVIWRNPRMITR